MNSPTDVLQHTQLSVPSGRSMYLKLSSPSPSQNARAITDANNASEDVKQQVHIITDSC